MHLARTFVTIRITVSTVYGICIQYNIILYEVTKGISSKETLLLKMYDMFINASYLDMLFLYMLL